MPEIKLKTEGKLISSFDSCKIRENIYSIDNSAVLEFTNKTTDNLKNAKNILVKGQKAEVLIDNEVVLKGYLSKVRPYYKKSSSKVVPCLSVKVSTPSARYVNNSIGSGQTFKSQNVSDIIKALCPDLELEVRSDRILPKFVVYGYEDYDEAISRLSVKSNLLIYSGRSGQLIIDEVATDKSKIGYFRTGENVIFIDVLEDEATGVTISGQLPLDDNVRLDDAVCSVLREAGEKVRFIYGDDVSPSALSAAKSKNNRIFLTTSNWFDSENRLFSINTWAGVVDSWLSLNNTMLLSAIAFSFDKSGYSADIELED